MVGETLRWIISRPGLAPQSLGGEKDVTALPIPVQPVHIRVERVSRSVARGVAMIGLFIRADVKGDRRDSPCGCLAQHDLTAFSGNEGDRIRHRMSDAICRR